MVIKIIISYELNYYVLGSENNVLYTLFYLLFIIDL